MTREELLEKMVSCYNQEGVVTLEFLGRKLGYRDPKAFRKILKEFDLRERKKNDADFV